MKFKGKSVLIIGDSLSHGKNSVGGHLAALLEDAGAAVAIDAKVGRSAHGFFRHEGGAERLRKYRAQRPDVVFIQLGTNSVNLKYQWRWLSAWPEGTKVICIGPPTLPPKEQALVDRDHVVARQKKHFSRWIDLRPLSQGAQRSPDQVHFTSKGAYKVAKALFDLVSARSFVKIPRSNLGLAACIPLFAVGWVIKRRMELADE